MARTHAAFVVDLLPSTILIPPFDSVEGHELLTPIEELSAVEQARLFSHPHWHALLDPHLFADPSCAIRDGSMERVAEFLHYLQLHCTADSAQFEAFTSGEGGLWRGIRLAVAYVHELCPEDAGGRQ